MVCSLNVAHKLPAGTNSLTIPLDLVLSALPLAPSSLNKWKQKSKYEMGLRDWLHIIFLQVHYLLWPYSFLLFPHLSIIPIHPPSLSSTSMSYVHTWFHASAQHLENTNEKISTTFVSLSLAFFFNLKDSNCSLFWKGHFTCVLWLNNTPLCA